MTTHAPDDPESIEYSLKILSIGMRQECVHYDRGALWFGGHRGLADADFRDWGLARAVAVILNAVLDGTLVKKDSQP